MDTLHASIPLDVFDFGWSISPLKHNLESALFSDSDHWFESVGMLCTKAPAFLNRTREHATMACIFRSKNRIYLNDG